MKCEIPQETGQGSWPGQACILMSGRIGWAHRKQIIMNLFNIFSMMVAGVLISGVATGTAGAAEKAGKAGKSEKQAKARSGRLQHVVSFKYKEDADASKVDAMVKAFGELPKKIKEIKGYEWGANVSPEKHDKGFTHCFIVTFKTAADRDAYLVHPAHKEFATLVGPIVADVFVVDFWSEK
jgi:hypothetical protein